MRARRGMVIAVAVAMLAVLHAAVVLVAMGSAEDVSASTSKLEAVRAQAAVDSAVFAGLRSVFGEIGEIGEGERIEFGSAWAEVVVAPEPGGSGELVVAGWSGRGSRMVGVGIE